MPPAKSKSTKKHAQSKPYSTSVGTSSSAASTPRASTATSSSPSYIKSGEATVAHFTEKVSLREICLAGIAKYLPHYTPQDDFEILALASWHHRPPHPTEAQIAAQVAEERRVLEMEWGENAKQNARQRLEEMVHPTGLKPTANTRHVYTRPLPESEYSIRLFPGEYSARWWTMDIVLTATGEPVNRPFEFGLFSIPNPKTPWLFGLGGEIRSLETGFGFKPDEILPGEEKYLLQDGQTCLLTRPGKQTVRFTVPIRPLPDAGKEKEQYIDLDFPEMLSPSDP